MGSKTGSPASGEASAESNLVSQIQALVIEGRGRVTVGAASVERYGSGLVVSVPHELSEEQRARNAEAERVRQEARLLRKASVREQSNIL